jgi:transposase
MATKKGKAVQYTRSFIERAVEHCDTANRPVAEVARDLGVEYGTLYGWMKKAGKTNRRVGPADHARPPALAAPPAPATPEAMQAEIDRLKRELDETKKQLEFAKKAAAFFAQHQK